MSRLTAARFCKLDFIVNFGVPLPTVTQMQQLIEDGTSDEITKLLDSLEVRHALIIYRYLSWAD
jgi:hypothetical protein